MHGGQLGSWRMNRRCRGSSGTVDAAIIASISFLTQSTLHIATDHHPAGGFQVHKDGYHEEGRKRLVQQGPDKDQEHPHITTHAEPDASFYSRPHEPVVLVGRVAQHEGADYRHEPHEKVEPPGARREGVPGEAEEQDGVGVTVEHGIEPPAKVAALALELTANYFSLLPFSANHLREILFSMYFDKRTLGRITLL